MAARYTAADCETLAHRLLMALGMPDEPASAVAQVLVEGELMGHLTHGLQLLPTYLGEIESGGMTVTGAPELLSARGAVQTWDGHRLPGPWLTLRAVETAMALARQHGVGAVSVRRSHHIAALAPYARRVADAGLVLLLLTSAPAACSVAPFGGTQGVFSPSPIGLGCPTGQAPVLVDVSTSITTNGLTAQCAREGRKLPGAWVQDEQGQPTDDPAVTVPPRRGSLLPLGGVDSGHKGTGLAWLVEALTAGLAGQGRDDPGPRWGATLFVQVLDPAAFAGQAAFGAALDPVVAACRNQPAADPARPVRLPGERALRLRAEGLQGGLVPQPAVWQAIAGWAQRLGQPIPVPMSMSNSTPSAG